MTDGSQGVSVIRRSMTTIAFACSISLAVLLVIVGASASGADPRSVPSPATSCPATGSLPHSHPTPEDFDPSAFSNPTTIDNRLLPSIPGTRFIPSTGSRTGNGLLPHRVVLTVSDMTKVIDGVPTVVVWDQDINDGHLVEAELAFHAQDDAANIWNLGEYPEEFEDGTFVGARARIAGIDGLEPGIDMLADPQVGTAGYLQGWAPSVDFADCGKVFETGTSVCVTLACYQDVLTVDEWNLLSRPRATNSSSTRPACWAISRSSVNDPEGEILQLVDIVQLSLEEMAQVRDEVLALDQRGRDVNDVYRQTAPLEPPPGVSLTSTPWARRTRTTERCSPTTASTPRWNSTSPEDREPDGFVAYSDRRPDPWFTGHVPLSCRPENAQVTPRSGLPTHGAGGGEHQVLGDQLGAIIRHRDHRQRHEPPGA